MNTFMQTLRSLGVVKLAATAGITLGVIMFLIFLTTRLSTPQMSLLFSDLEPTDSARIATQLETQKVPFEVSADGTRILVPTDQAGRLRITLAEQGLTGNVIGWEIFDRDQTLGSSNFVQNINQLRALEGELARTIASLSPVRGARVHLVLPRRELFSREHQEPTASIVLKMRGATRLDRGQVQAVQYLVATAVPGLSPQNIAIIDDRGTLLARGGGGEEGMFHGLSANEMRSQVEARMTRTLEQLLEPIVGIGNVRAEVRADLSFDREVINEERYDPEGQVVRSTQSSEQSSSNREGQEPVTVGINLPDAPGATGGNQTQSQDSRTEEATNFEISKTVRNLIREAGEVRRLSVAVLVNGTNTEGTNGQSQYQPRSQEELQQIDALVKSAIGYDASRNDTVQIVNLQFAELPKDLISEEPNTYFGMRPSDIRRLAEIIVLAVVGVLVILLIVRPVIAKIFEVTPDAIARATRGDDRPLLTDRMAPAGMSSGMLEGPGGDDMLPGPSMGRGASEVENMIDLQQVEGRVKASSIRKIGEIIDKHPEEAVAILRTWMYQNR